MSYEEKGAFFCGCVAMFLLMLVVMGIALDYKRNRMRNEAVKAKVAEYYLDDNNEKQFRYKECKWSSAKCRYKQVLNDIFINDRATIINKCVKIIELNKQLAEAKQW